ncbi:MAG: molybdenum cofactor guanylyltransferase [Candidatus Bipolaricaulota bacterium]|nr:molybdenum cofactor guanylyltransferase [Candidatus Bipolaricaulota bacterium]
MSEAATLIILAGGESKRMGRPKHQLSKPRGGTVLDHLGSGLSRLFNETLIVGRNLLSAESSFRVVEDVYLARSPLVGIYSGIVAAKTELSFVIACDMPFVRSSLVEHILSQSRDVDACVPIVNGYYEPLCAAYRRSAIPAIAEAIERGMFKVTAPYKNLNLRTIPEEELRRFDEELVSFTNLNVPRQLELLSQL